MTQLDAKFSKDAFVENPDAIAKELQDYVQCRLHPILMGEMEKIVAELNQLGHNLKPRYDFEPGDIHYRDWVNQHCDLMLACDTVISASFGTALEV